MQQAELLVAASAPGLPARVLRIQGPSLPVRLALGEQATVRAPGYRPLALPSRLPSGHEGQTATPSGRASVTTVWLDAEDPPLEMSPSSVQARLLPGAALLHGHVTDGATLEPMAGVTVSLEKAGVATSTDQEGYFWLTAPGARAAHTAAELPDTDDLLLEAAGYKLYRLANVALFETDTHFVVDMERGSGETGRDDAHEMLRALRESPSAGSGDEAPRPGQGAAPPEADPLLASPGTVARSASVFDPPDSIDVEGWGIVSLETYVANGLNDEWIASWSPSSLRAGAVAYRSYGAWHQINHGSICATASCQVYDSDSSTSTVLAARSTAGILLERGGAVARSDYSAENGCYRCGADSRADTDLGCGSGFAGSPAAGWSCLHDAHAVTAGPGQCCFGHGRGMCQWGTEAWAGTGSNWAWMVNHYYNDEGAGTGLRTMFMTSPLTIAGASARPPSVTPGSSFTVSLTGRSYAEHPHGQVLLRTRLVNTSGTVANGSADPKVTLGARTDTALQALFAVPSTASAGTYDLVVEVWLDVDENGAVDAPDLWLDSRTVPAAVTITAGTGCVATVPSNRWKGRYWTNKNMAGDPALVRDDGAGVLGFDWGKGGPRTCGVGTNSFSARWTRTVSFDAGTYRFTVTSDDGFRLYVDGALRLDKWILQGATTYTVDVRLTAGKHVVRMDYFENTGYAVAKLSWALVASRCVAAVPSDRWKGEYWSNRDLTGAPAMVRDDGAGAIDFDWSTGGPGTCGVGADNFSARWSRTLGVATSGTYRFTVTSDDGVRLYVDDALQLDKWILQGATTYTVDVPLTAGSHTLRMEYFENGGLAVARLSWQSPSVAAPSFDAASSATAETANLSWVHAVAGSDRLLLVGTAIRADVPVASVTYAGLPLTKIRHDTFGIDVRSELWYLVGPPVGTQSVSVQLASAGSVVAGATSWTGVDQANPFASQGGATHGGSAGTTAAVTLPSAADQVVVDVVATQAAGATLTASPLDTQRWNRQGNYGNGAGSSQVGKAATTMSWTLAYPEFWTISAVALRGSRGEAGLEWPNTESAANSDPWLALHHGEIRRMRPRVLALNFVNHRSMDGMRAQLQQVIDLIAEGSRYHGYTDADAPPFLQYELAYAVDLRDPQPPLGWPYRNSTLYPRENPVEGAWGFDYEQLFTPRFTELYNVPDPNDPSRKLGLCELIDRGLVHDVWVYGDADVPDVGAAEVLEMKPVYDENRQRVPGQMNRCAGNGCFDEEDVIPCTRTVRIAWFNNSRGPGCFLESLGHGLESMGGSPSSPIPYLRRYFVPFASFDLDTRYGLPFRNWYVCPYEGPHKENCLGYPSETSITYDTGTFAGAIGNYDPVCGNVHFPINARGQYDLGGPATVRTSCANYRDGSGQTMAFTTQQFAPYTTLAPDCMGPWLVWWYQNVPGLDNASRDDAGAPMLNWWPFLFY